jgi:DNA-binding transcriptional ArsR family regulator
MRGDANIAAAAVLLAEPTRAALVLAVMDDGPLPASELAARAGIAPSTASENLARLVAGGFLVPSRSGRRCYYDLADPAVARAVEALAVVATQPQVGSLRETTRGELLRCARTCYDHLAGRLGVAVALALEHEQALARRGGTYVLGQRAVSRFAALGIEVGELERQQRPLVRGCMDWSERELHLAGALGAALTERLFELGWVKRRDGNRSLEVTNVGHERLAAELGVERGRARTTR